MRRRDIEKLVKKHAQRLSVTEYRLTLEIVDDYQETEGAYGSCMADEMNGTAVIALDRELCSGKQSLVEETIIHEMLELRLWSIRELMYQFYSPSVINREIHKVIRSIERHL